MPMHMPVACRGRGVLSESMIKDRDRNFAAFVHACRRRAPPVHAGRAVGAWGGGGCGRLCFWSSSWTSAGRRTARPSTRTSKRACASSRTSTSDRCVCRGCLREWRAFSRPPGTVQSRSCAAAPATACLHAPSPRGRARQCSSCRLSDEVVCRQFTFDKDGGQIKVKTAANVRGQRFLFFDGRWTSLCACMRQQTPCAMPRRVGRTALFRCTPGQRGQMCARARV